MHRAHKIQLKPNKEQQIYLNKAFGVARFAYNYSLSWWHDVYQLHKIDPTLPKPNQLEARKHFNMVKDSEFPWVREVTKCAPQYSIMNLGKAFDGFFKKNGAYPKFKKKGNNDSFQLDNTQFKINNKKIHIPKLGWVRLSESLRFDGKLLNATISKRANKYFVSIAVELPTPAPKPKPINIGGIDLGVREFVESDGTIHHTPRSYRRNQTKLKRRQQSLSRKVKGSNNRTKAKQKVAKVHYDIANQRSDFTHKLTSNLVNKYSILCIEDLAVKNLTKKGKYKSGLNKSILDSNFFEFRRQLEYKSIPVGTQIIVADRWFPSSKLCSNCSVKTKQKLRLHIRSWVCEYCGISHHRDINAAKNLKNYAVSSTVSACGEFLASEPDLGLVQVTSVKQEVVKGYRGVTRLSMNSGTVA